MPYDAIVDSRCDGERIEVTVIRHGRFVVVPISAERAVQIAHDLLGHAIEMMNKKPG